jgi:hypothetical protein
LGLVCLGEEINLEEPVAILIDRKHARVKRFVLSNDPKLIGLAGWNCRQMGGIEQARFSLGSHRILPRIQGSFQFLPAS